MYRDEMLWPRVALLCLLVGAGIGIVLGIDADGARPVQIDLFGWAFFALAGVVYAVFPQAGGAAPGRMYFWLLNLGLPVIILALAHLLTAASTPGIARTLIVIALAAAFSVNLCANLVANLPRRTP